MTHLLLYPDVHIEFPQILFRDKNIKYFIVLTPEAQIHTDTCVFRRISVQKVDNICIEFHPSGILQSTTYLEISIPWQALI